MDKTIIRAQGLSLKYENSIILNKGSFSVYEGELLAICQTSQIPSFFLMLLNEQSIRFEGTLTYMGQPQGKDNPIDYAYVGGLNTLIDTLSIVDNLYAFIDQGRLLYNKRRAAATIADMMKTLELPFDIHQSIDELSVSQKYLLELAKAILIGPKIIILDNISRNCNVDDYAWIVKTLQRDSARGRTFILLSNEDNFLISKCSRIYFCRGTSIIDLIFGDEYAPDLFQRILYGSHETVHKQRTGIAATQANALRIALPHQLATVPVLAVHFGEVFGIFDLFGTLAEEVYSAFFSAFPYEIDGVLCNTYEEAVQHGLAIIAPHRKNALFDTFSLEENLVFPALRRISKHGIINRRMERYCSGQYLPKLIADYDSHEAELEKFKLLFYRSMLTNPKILVIDNPPLDLDAQQQAEVEELLNQDIAAGCALVLISSNANIGIPLCDRTLILQKRPHG